MQLNGINLQPKIGTDFIAQYGEGNSTVAASTMAHAYNPSGQLLHGTIISTHSRNRF